ncbi:MAG TPA: TolC family protein [Cytophagaceae bacterium]|jgi:outer membrane protein
MNSKFIFPYLFLLLPFLCLGQTKVWTLDQCLEEAYLKNSKISQSKLTADQRQISLKQAKGAFLPTTYAGASHNYQFGRSVDPSTNQFEQQNYRTNFFSISSGLTLFKGFQNITNVEQNKWALKASLSDIENSKNEIGISIVSAYMEVLLCYELVENAKAQTEASQSNSKMYRS